MVEVIVNMIYLFWDKICGGFWVLEIFKLMRGSIIKRVSFGIGLFGWEF